MIHLFIINPAAGSRDRTEQYRKNITRICSERGLDYRIAVSSAPGECARLTREAALTGEEYRVYACGGDGTLNEVAAGAAGYPNVAVTCYRGGSGNDFVKIFGDADALDDCVFSIIEKSHPSGYLLPLRHKKMAKYADF